MKVKTPTITGMMLRYFLYYPSGAIFIFTVTAIPLLSNTPLFITCMTAVVVGVALYGCLDAFRLLRYATRVKHRQAIIEAALPGSSTEARYFPSDTAVFSSLELIDQGGETMFSALKDKDWTLIDYAFDKVTHYKHADFKTAQVHYSIVCIELPRALPHMVFDSRKTRGKQLRFKFDKGQRIKLEGNFDTFFDSYFPSHYEIDFLSIITPEVMESLIEMKDFDIEIFGSSLFIYAPLLPSVDVAAVISKGSSVRTKLMNNILTYSDDRLGTKNRKEVHAYGMTIQSNFLLHGILFGLFGVIALSAAVFQVIYMLQNDLSFYILDQSYGFLIAAIAAFVLTTGSITTFYRGYAERDARKSASR